MRVSVSTRLCGAASGVAMLIVCGVVWSCVPQAARAAGTAMAPPELRAAVTDAWSRHPEAMATQATIDAARARAEAADQPVYNPEFELNADDEGPDRSATGGIGLTLDLSGKRRARTGVADANVDVALATAQLRRRDFARTWLDAWSSVIAAERRVTLGGRRTSLLERAAELAVRQFAAGDISSLDRDFALLARDEAAADQATLVADLASARASLRSLDGTATTPARIAFAGPEVAPAMALETLPEWVIARSSASAARAQVVVAERDRLADPTVSLHGGRIELADGASDNLYGISVSVPLFVRNSHRAEVAAAMADARAADADLERVRHELQARAERASGTYRAMHEAWRRWQQSPGTNVEARAELLERLWRAGEMSTSDYLLQLQQTVDTALAGAELEGRLWLSFTDCLAATGLLERWLGLAVPTGE